MALAMAVRSEDAALRLRQRIFRSAKGGACTRLADFGDSGSAISQSGYHTAGWLSASIPTTVLAAQVAAGTYKDIFYATNLPVDSGNDLSNWRELLESPNAARQPLSLRLVVPQGISTSSREH